MNLLNYDSWFFLTGSSCLQFTFLNVYCLLHSLKETHSKEPKNTGILNETMTPCNIIHIRDDYYRQFVEIYDHLENKLLSLSVGDSLGWVS